MECYYHPSVESTDVCAICGKSICKECGLEIAGKVYCKDCLEKIVGLSVKNTPQEKPVQEAPKPERQEPEEVQFSKIAEDSPYNIKESIKYEGGLESRYGENLQPEGSLYETIENIQTPQEPVQDVRQEYVQQEPVMEEVLRQPAGQARNEYDYVQRQAQAPPANDYIYPDHSYQPEETSARREVEDKYERYLDDLYFDEAEIPLNEQLARDEAQYGSLTRNEYPPRNAPQQQPSSDDDLERRIREELMRKEQGGKSSIRREQIHNLQYEDKKEPFGALDILLSIVLIIVVLIVLFYIVYLIKLSATYPTFIDALFGLKNPGMLLNALLH
ncbi:hypothetical protein [Methanobrevibacter sp.]|uniref:hypothetical protein n=1 Tax=Methanobrevibacter sp. TaxID=66852 RepID=UPI002E775A19|nr:hypothetical protein [Methanobrevibacter sp.]MEE0024732.1 hypothetical protein [Methanobrevibacter sp.]